jgi:GNAT superfamily N-acetyltransferase
MSMKHKVSDVRIQEFEAAHYQGVVEVHNSIYPEHRTTLEELRFEDETWDRERYFFKRWVALGTAERVVAYGEAGHSVSVFHPRRFWMQVGVHPEWQGRRIGTRLYDHIMEVLSRKQPMEVLTHVREDMESGLRFAKRRGFVERMRAWESVLDLSSFDHARFRGYVEKLRGVEITTMAKEREVREDFDVKLHELQTTLMADVPLPGRYTPISLDLFRRWALESPGIIPEAYFLAKVGDEYIAQCVLERELGMEGVLVHGLTGVRREYRGRGIAIGLKVTALQWAKQAGYRQVKTWNDSTNRGMLAINEKLGFKRRPAWITLVKRMEGGE